MFSEILTRQFELQDEDLHIRLCYFMWVSLYADTFCSSLLFSHLHPFTSSSFVPASQVTAHQERVDEVVGRKKRKKGGGWVGETWAIRCPHGLNTVICHEAESLRKD